jgi:hypothetical protein
VAPEYVTEEDGKKKTRWSLTVPPGFFKRFYGRYEIALEVKRTIIPKAIKVQVPFEIAGVQHFKEETRSINETCFELIGEDSERASLFKRRIPLPAKIQLSSQNPWDDFVSKYNEYAKPSVS